MKNTYLRGVNSPWGPAAFSEVTGPVEYDIGNNRSKFLQALAAF